MLNNGDDNRRDGKSRRQHLVEHWRKLSIEDLCAVRDDVAVEINTRKGRRPWFGLYIPDEGKWLNRSLNTTTDTSKAMKWRNIHVADSWMTLALDKGHRCEVRPLGVFS
jgi:hypothetical protein